MSRHHYHCFHLLILLQTGQQRLRRSWSLLPTLAVASLTITPVTQTAGIIVQSKRGVAIAPGLYNRNQLVASPVSAVLGAHGCHQKASGLRHGTKPTPILLWKWRQQTPISVTSSSQVAAEYGHGARHGPLGKGRLGAFVGSPINACEIDNSCYKINCVARAVSKEIYY